MPPNRLAVPNTSLSLAHAWQLLADGLHVQRLVLYLRPWLDILAAPDSPPDWALGDIAPRDLGGAPVGLGDPAARDAVRAAGLAGWVDLPQQHGTPAGPPSPLEATATAVAVQLLEGMAEGPLRAGAQAVAAASGWWVGYFATIRHLGVHHITLLPVTGTVTRSSIESAVRAVTVGVVTRTLEQHLRAPETNGDHALRLAYCRAVTAAIAIEPDMPRLLDALGELRLVDLVATSMVWRGQFTKYAGGTGAGQVE